MDHAAETAFWHAADDDDDHDHSPTTEAETGASEVLIGEEAAVCHELIWNLAAEALAKGLDGGERD